MTAAYREDMTSTSQAQTGAERVVRVGLIGCGKMGLQHLRAIKATPGAIVVGVADPAADREALQSLLPPDARILSDARELLEDVRPDVVHIVTPPATHAALARQALVAGCHVYVEKPFTPTRAEAESVFALAAERGLKVCAGHQYLFEGPSLAALEALGSIGRIVHIESYFSFQTARRTITPVDQAKDILPHAVYPLVEQLRTASGRTEGAIEIAGLDVRSDGDIYALLRLGDVTGVLFVTLNGRPVEQYQHIVGTNGAFRADYITRLADTARRTRDGAGHSVHPLPARVPDADGGDPRLREADLRPEDLVPGVADHPQSFLPQHRGRHSPAALAAVDSRHRRSLRAHRRAARCGRARHGGCGPPAAA